MLTLVVVAVVAACWALPAGLTATGARARGQRLPVALLVGLVFPLTWAVWYVRDSSATPSPHARRGKVRPIGYRCP